VEANILMVTYNRLDLTKQTLDNIFETTKYPFKFSIVDNASSDDTVNYLIKYFSNIKNEFYRGGKLLVNSKNLGIGVGRNQTLLLAGESDYYATLDNDIKVPDNWLSDCINIIQNNPKYGMIGINFEGTRYPLVQLGEYKVQHKSQGNLGTACMVFPNKLKKMIGAFNDVDYGIYGLEDSDYGFRARVAGFNLGYLEQDGFHLGQGENDVGEYREFKTKEHNSYVQKFYDNCKLYYSQKKSIFLPFKKEKYNLENIITL
jgi:GT2 family glycosyltransferase